MDRRLGRCRNVRCWVWRPGTRTAGQRAGTPRATRQDGSVLARPAYAVDVFSPNAQCQAHGQWRVLCSAIMSATGERWKRRAAMAATGERVVLIGGGATSALAAVRCGGRGVRGGV